MSANARIQSKNDRNSPPITTHSKVSPPFPQHNYFNQTQMIENIIEL